MLRRLTSAILGVFLVHAVAFAQLTTGTVQGTVQDPSGAVVPGVELSLLNVDTNLTLVQRSNNSGAYVFSNVPPGTYVLLAKLENFKTSETTGLVVEVNRNTVVNVAIEPGNLAESVEVSAGADIIDTQSSVVRTNISSRMITELPSNSRNPLQFAELAPGVDLNTGSLTGGSQLLGLGGVTASVSGARQQQNTFYLDGADNSAIRLNEGLQAPNVEAIQEVQVVTNSNSAEYGRQPGGYFNIITKGGTNEIHGSSFLYFRDRALNANEWQRNRQGLEKPEDQMRQWGGTAGGPILRNKTFYFGSYQRFSDQNTITSSTVRYPTQRMIAGDFSEFQGQLYHPITREPIPNNNLAAAGVLDPVAQRIAAELIPTVPRLGDRLVWDHNTPAKNNEFLGKVDHNVSVAQRLNVSYFGTRGNTAVVPGGSSGNPKYALGSNQVRQHTFSGRHTWTMNAQTTLESQVSFAQFNFNSAVDPSTSGRDLSDFGANAPQPIRNGIKTMPALNITDGPNPGQVGGDQYKQGNLRGTMTLGKMKGSHYFRLGFEIQRSSLSRLDLVSDSDYRFLGRFTNQGNNVAARFPNELFARSFADFMTGWTEFFAARGPRNNSLPVWGYFGFAQDQWQLNRRFTLNYGLRYEIWGAFREASGQAASFVEGHQSDRFPKAPLHMAFEGDRGIPEGFIKQDKNNFAPRLGMAWDVFGDDRTVVRGGYGLYYAFPGALIRTNATDEFPVSPRLQGFEAQLSNPWLTSVTPRWTTMPVPFPDNALDWVREADFQPPFPRMISYDPGFNTPMSHQWNISAEREIRNGLTMTLGYVANVSRNLLQTVPFNYARFHNLPNGAAPSASAANINARQPFTDYGPTSLRVDTSGVIDYHSLQFSSNVRRRDIDARFTYVFARDFGNGGGSSLSVQDEDPNGFTTQIDNPANPEAEYGRRSRIHTFRAFYTYQVPFLREHTGWAGRLLGRWQISGTTTISSGRPLNVILGYDANFDGITTSHQDRPDLVGPITYTNGSTAEKMARYFDPSVFKAPTITPQNTFGNLQRNALFAPGEWNSTLALIKSFEVRQGMRAQFRLEAYNWLNHANLDNPVTNMSRGDFTQILTRSGNRTMQMGLLLRF
jgi:hypothetical protein